jgi:hypothetical protein
MKHRGDKCDDIALCIFLQLKELQPECERYRQIFFWAQQNLDRVALDKYGFGTTPTIPFPIEMHNKVYYDAQGNQGELYCLSSCSSFSVSSSEEEHEERLQKGGGTSFSPLDVSV